MKTMLCLLCMLSFLVACASHSGVTHVSPSRPSAVHKASKKPTGSEYQDLVTNSAIARYMRGKPLPSPSKRPVEFVCVATGQFNLTANHQNLLMRFRCVERHHDGLPQIRIMKDQPMPNVRGGHYSIPFENADVSISNEDGKQEVRLHYQDANGEPHNELLLPLEEEYTYSFSELSPDTITPIGEIRMLKREVKYENE